MKHKPTALKMNQQYATQTKNMQHELIYITKTQEHETLNNQHVTHTKKLTKMQNQPTYNMN